MERIGNYKCFLVKHFYTEFQATEENFDITRN